MAHYYCISDCMNELWNIENAWGGTIYKICTSIHRLDYAAQNSRVFPGALCLSDTSHIQALGTTVHRLILTKCANNTSWISEESSLYVQYIHIGHFPQSSPLVPCTAQYIRVSGVSVRYEQLLQSTALPPHEQVALISCFSILLSMPK